MRVGVLVFGLQPACLFKWLWRLNVLSHLGHFSSTLTGFGSCFIMCLFSFEGCAATKSHWVQFKECWSSVDWNLPMWPSLVFTTLIWTLWVVWMCFSKNSALFNVLSQILHWILHLFLSMCSFKWCFLVKTTWQFLHLNSPNSPHFSLWLVLLL